MVDRPRGGRAGSRPRRTGSRTARRPCRRPVWPCRAGSGCPGPGALAGVNAAGDRQVIGAQALDGIGMELDIGVDPEGFFEAGGQGIGGHLVAALVDGRIAAHPPHLVAAALEFDQPSLAGGRNVGGKRHENDATARIHHLRRGGLRSRHSILFAIKIQVPYLAKYANSRIAPRGHRAGKRGIIGCRTTNSVVLCYVMFPCEFAFHQLAVKVRPCCPIDSG